MIKYPNSCCNPFIFVSFFCKLNRFLKASFDKRSFTMMSKCHCIFIVPRSTAASYCVFSFKFPVITSVTGLVCFLTSQKGLSYYI